MAHIDLVSSRKMSCNDSLLALFGDTLLWHAQSDQRARPVDVLVDRTVLIFFSAR